MISFFFEDTMPTQNAVSVRAHYILMQGGKSCGGYLYSKTSSALNYEGFRNVTVKDIIPSTRLVCRLINETLRGFSVSGHYVKNSKKQDLLVVSTPSFFSTMIICIACIITGRGYILDVRDIYPQSLADAGLIDRQSRTYKTLMKISVFLYQKAKYVFCATDGILSIIQKYNKKSEIVYNGFPRNMVKSTYQKNKSVIFHGTLGLMQDIDLLLLISQRLYDDYGIRVDVYGDGKLSGKVSSSQSLNYFGVRSHEELLEIICEYRVGLSFRQDNEVTRGSFPVKVWEYIGGELAIVVTPRSEAGEFIEQQKIGMQFDADQVDDIIKFIILTLEKYGADYDFDRAKYSRETQAEKFYQRLDCIYQENLTQSSV